MGLVDVEDLGSVLACPCCHGRVIHDGTFRCTSESCEFSAPAGFPQVGRWPILIDFADSIMTMAGLEAADRVPAAARWSATRVPVSLRSWLRRPNRAAARNLEHVLSLLPDSSPLVLVIGGGTIGNGADVLYENKQIRLIALDIYASPFTQIIADAHRVPLADSTVDAVVIQAVLEHVLDPARVVREIHRVLQPGGLVYAETPFLQHVHAGPWDFTRFTSSGHRYLFRSFEEIAAGAVAGPGTVLLWSIDHLIRGLLRSQLAGKLARAMLFWLSYLDRCVAPSYALDAASACFFLGRRSDRDLTPTEIIRRYGGAQRTAEGGSTWGSTSSGPDLAVPDAGSVGRLPLDP